MNLSSIITILQEAVRAGQELEKNPSDDTVSQTLHARLNDVLCEIIALKCAGPKDALQTTVEHVKKSCDRLISSTPQYVESLLSMTNALISGSFERVQAFFTGTEATDVNRPLTTQEAELLHDIHDYIQIQNPTTKVDYAMALHMLSLVQAGFSKETAYAIVQHKSYRLD